MVTTTLKDFESSASETGSPVTKRSLGVAACTAIVIGNMVGSGFYLSPALLAPYGNLAILAWVDYGSGRYLPWLDLCQARKASTGDGGALCLHAHGLRRLRRISHGMGFVDFNVEFAASHSARLRGRRDGPVPFDAQSPYGCGAHTEPLSGPSCS